MASMLADLRLQLYDLELREDEVLRDLARYGIPPQERQAAYIAAWVEMLFSLLLFLAQDDEEELKRLCSARRWFFESMAELADRPGARDPLLEARSCGPSSVLPA
jgi:hypothetical protein